MNRWWLSFADDDGNLGISIVQGETFVDAVKRSHALGCNPGGEVAGALVPKQVLKDEPGLASIVDRAMTPGEIDRHTVKKSHPQYAEALDKFLGRARKVCQRCNNSDCSC